MKIDFWIAFLLAVIMGWAIVVDMYQIGLRRAAKTYEFWSFAATYVVCCIVMYADSL